MNRTLPSSLGTPVTSTQIVPSQDVANWFGRQPFALPTEQTPTATAHSCFAPMHYESSYAYPLIVWMHGPNSSEDELRQVMPLISTRNHVAIAPRGTRHVEGSLGAFRWEDSVDGIAEAGERVGDCIAIAKERFNINADRVFIAGHSMGGTMAHRLGMEFPELFAGAISLGGEVPRGSRLLKHINRVRQLPLMLSVSPAGESNLRGYSIERIMDDLRFLHCAGMSLALKLYPEGDELTTIMLEDLNSWVMEQICSSSPATAS